MPYDLVKGILADYDNEVRYSVMSKSSRNQGGKHVLVDFFGVDPALLRNQGRLMRTLKAALKQGGFTIIRQSDSHKFRTGGQGVTGFFMLAQSHAAFHSYPEFGYFALDIYSCGSHDPKPVAEAMRGLLRPRRVSRLFHRRGLKAFGAA